MAEAWIVRSNQRQHLIQSLRRKLFEIEDAHGRREVGFALSRVILDFLETGQIDMKDEPASKFFRLTVFLDIRRFARSDEEQNALLSDFLECAVTSVTAEHRQALQREEIMDPKKIFHAETAMTEIAGNLLLLYLKQ